MRIPKDVKAQTVAIRPEEFGQMVSLAEAYSDCMDLFYSRFSGINSMCIIQKKNKLRDAIRQEQKGIPAARAQGTGNGRKTLTEQFGFQDRHWVMALFDACTNIDSAWSSLAEKIKERLRDNADLSKDERMLCCYTVSARPYWQAVLLEKPFPGKVTAKFKELLGKVDPGRLHYLRSMLRRVTRSLKAKIPRTRKRRSMALDQEMYSITEDRKKGVYYLEFVSQERGRRFKVQLRGAYTWKKKGNIRLVLDRDTRTATVHKLIQAKCRPAAAKGPTAKGIDKGYHTLLSCSDDREYGIGVGPLMTAEAQRLDKRNTARNPYIQKKKGLDALSAEIRSSGDVPQAERDKWAAAIEKEAAHLEKHNLGNKKYNRQRRRGMGPIISVTNHSIYTMVRISRPTLAVKEKLSLIPRGPGKKGRKGQAKRRGKDFNRRMSNWISGFLDKRIEYIMAFYRGKTEDVNAAYTSQYCPCCGARITRKGKHSEVSVCPSCGEGNANTGAAKVILSRYRDPEITLYTPYREVGRIMDRRYAEKCKAAQQPAT